MTKRKLTTIAITFALILLSWNSQTSVTVSSCDTGCLRCADETDTNGNTTGTKTCLVCDSMMNYITQNGRCYQQVLPNCMISFEPETCHHCNYGYFLTGEYKCVAMDRKSDLAIKNCNYYGQADQCRACNMNTYERNGFCRPVFTKTRNCIVYENSKTCRSCDLKLISYDGLTCNSVPSSETYDNCLLFRHPVKCTKCSPGYTKNLNLYMQSINDFYIQKDFMFHLKFWYNQYFNIVFNTAVCKRVTTIPNCGQLNYYGTCETCESDYTLSPNMLSCFIKPKPPVNPKVRIPNCYKFASANYETCDICYEKYYLTDNNTKCKLHDTIIPNCIIHSQTTEKECVYCDNEYYINSQATNTNEICTKRTNFFINCYTYNRTLDVCVSCAENHLFHATNTYCSKKIDNCIDHDIGSQVLKCTECDDGYYLNDFSTSCENANGKVDGCLKYKQGAVCKECIQLYYLISASNICRLQEKFINCSIYSVETPNVCDKCNKDSVRTDITSKCTAVSDIILADLPNCIKFDEDNICIACIDNYVVFSSTSGGITTVGCTKFIGCSVLKTITDQRKCGLCMSDYYLFNDTCNLPNSANCIYSYDNYPKTNYDFGIVDVAPCRICSPKMYYQSVVAIEESQKCITFTERITNCLTYAVDSNIDIICSRCRRAYVYSTDQKSCVDLLSTNIYSYNLMFQYSTTTAGFAITNCSIVDSTSAKCLDCKSSRITLYSYDNTSSTDGIKELTEDATKYSYKKYTSYTTSSGKTTNETFYMQETVAVSSCYNNSTVNLYSSIKYFATVDSNKYYLCENAQLASSNVTFSVGETGMLVSNTNQNFSTSDDYVTYWKTTTTTKVGAVCSSSSLSNCSEHYSARSINLPFNVLFFLSCTACNSGYHLTYGIYDATVTYDSTVTTFKWIINACETLAAVDGMPTDVVVSNCYFYKKYIKVQDVFYECQACKAKYYPVQGLAPKRCLKNDAYYDKTRSDRCKIPYKCGYWNYCEPDCNPTCTGNTYCSPDLFTDKSVCVSQSCTDCTSTDTTICINGCPLNKLCQNAKCYNKCQCANDNVYQCDASTNYFCIAKVCEPQYTIEAFNFITRGPAVTTFRNTVLSKINADGSITRTRDDGTVQQIYPDGGNIITKYTDRVTIITGTLINVGDYPTPTTGLTNPALRIQITNYDKSVTDIYPSGYRKITYYDGDLDPTNNPYDIIDLSGVITCTRFSDSNTIVSINTNGVRNITTKTTPGNTSVSSETINLSGVSVLTDSTTSNMTTTYLNNKRMIDVNSNGVGIDQVIDHIHKYIVDYDTNKKIVKKCSTNNSILVLSEVTYKNPGLTNSESQISIKNISDATITITIIKEIKTVIPSSSTPCLNTSSYPISDYYKSTYYSQTDYTTTDNSKYSVYHTDASIDTVYTDALGNIRTDYKNTGATPYIKTSYYYVSDGSTLKYYSDTSSIKTYTSGTISKVEVSSAGVTTTTYTDGKVVTVNGNTTTIGSCIEVFDTSTNNGTMTCSGITVATSTYDSTTNKKTITKTGGTLTYSQAAAFNSSSVLTTVFIDNTTTPLETTEISSTGVVVISSSAKTTTINGTLTSVYDISTESTTYMDTTTPTKVKVVDSSGNIKTTDTTNCSSGTCKTILEEKFGTDASSTSTYGKYYQEIYTITDLLDVVQSIKTTDLLTGDYKYENKVDGTVTEKVGTVTTSITSAGDTSVTNGLVLTSTNKSQNKIITVYYFGDNTIKKSITALYTDVTDLSTLIQKETYDATVDPATTTTEVGGSITKITYDNTVEVWNGTDATITTYTSTNYTTVVSVETVTSASRELTVLSTNNKFKKEYTNGILTKTTKTTVSPSVVVVSDYDADGVTINKTAETATSSNGTTMTTITTTKTYASTNVGNTLCLNAMTIAVLVTDTSSSQDVSLTTTTYIYNTSLNLAGKETVKIIYYYNGSTQQEASNTVTVYTISSTYYTASASTKTGLIYNTDGILTSKVVTTKSLLPDGETVIFQSVETTTYDVSNTKIDSVNKTSTYYYAKTTATQKIDVEATVYSNGLKSVYTQTVTEYNELGNITKTTLNTYTYDASENYSNTIEDVTTFDIDTVTKTTSKIETTYSSSNSTIKRQIMTTVSNYLNENITDKTITTQVNKTESNTASQITAVTTTYNMNNVNTQISTSVTDYYTSDNKETTVTTTEYYVSGALNYTTVLTNSYNDVSSATISQATYVETYYTGGTLEKHPEDTFMSNLTTTAAEYTYTMIDYYSVIGEKAREYIEIFSTTTYNTKAGSTIGSMSHYTFTLTLKDSGGQNLYYKEKEYYENSGSTTTFTKSTVQDYDGTSYTKTMNSIESIASGNTYNHKKNIDIYYPATASDTPSLLSETYISYTGTTADTTSPTSITGYIKPYVEGSSTASITYTPTDIYGNGSITTSGDVYRYYVGGTTYQEISNVINMSFGTYPTLGGYTCNVAYLFIKDRSNMNTLTLTDEITIDLYDSGSDYTITYTNLTTGITLSAASTSITKNGDSIVETANFDLDGDGGTSDTFTGNTSHNQIKYSFQNYDTFDVYTDDTLGITKVDGAVIKCYLSGDMEVVKSGTTYTYTKSTQTYTTATSSSSTSTSKYQGYTQTVVVNYTTSPLNTTTTTRYNSYTKVEGPTSGQISISYVENGITKTDVTTSSGDRTLTVPYADVTITTVTKSNGDTTYTETYSVTKSKTITYTSSSTAKVTNYKYDASTSVNITYNGSTTTTSTCTSSAGTVTKAVNTSTKITTLSSVIGSTTITSSVNTLTSVTTLSNSATGISETINSTSWVVTASNPSYTITYSISSTASPFYVYAVTSSTLSKYATKDVTTYTNISTATDTTFRDQCETCPDFYCCSKVFNNGACTVKTTSSTSTNVYTFNLTDGRVVTKTVVGTSTQTLTLEKTNENKKILYSDGSIEEYFTSEIVKTYTNGQVDTFNLAMTYKTRWNPVNITDLSIITTRVTSLNPLTTVIGDIIYYVLDDSKASGIREITIYFLNGSFVKRYGDSTTNSNYYVQVLKNDLSNNIYYEDNSSIEYGIDTRGSVTIRKKADGTYTKSYDNGSYIEYYNASNELLRSEETGSGGSFTIKYSKETLSTIPSTTTSPCDSPETIVKYVVYSNGIKEAICTGGKVYILYTTGNYKIVQTNGDVVTYDTAKNELTTTYPNGDVLIDYNDSGNYQITSKGITTLYYTDGKKKVTDASGVVTMYYTDSSIEVIQTNGSSVLTTPRSSSGTFLIAEDDRNVIDVVSTATNGTITETRYEGTVIVTVPNVSVSVTHFNGFTSTYNMVTNVLTITKTDSTNTANSYVMALTGLSGTAISYNQVTDIYTITDNSTFTTKIMPGVNYNIVETGKTTKTNIFGYLDANRVPGTNMKTTYGSGRILEMPNDTTKKEQYPTLEVYSTKATTNTDATVAVNTFTNSSNTKVVRAFSNESRITTMTNFDTYNIDPFGNMIITYAADATKVSKAINRFEIETIIYKSGTQTVLDSNLIVPNGCPSINQLCMKRTCYTDYKCDCATGTYCSLSNTIQNKIFTTCVSSTICAACSGTTPYCRLNTTTNNPECASTKQTYYNDNVTCSCSTGFSCIDGACRPSDSVCFYALEGTMPIYCSADERCQEYDTGKYSCYKYCNPDCPKKDICTFSETNLVMSCVEQPKVLIDEILITTCTSISNCDSSSKLNTCEKCSSGYYFDTTLANSTYTINYKSCVAPSSPISNCCAVNNSNSSTYTCVQCIPGYNLKDNVCIINITYCASFDSTGVCEWCDSAYTDRTRILVYAKYDTGDCTTYPTNTSALNTVLNPTESINCKYFDYYITSSTNKLRLTAGTNNCIECDSGYFLNNASKCLTKNVLNCDTYSTGSSSPADIWCSACSVGYRATNQVSKNSSLGWTECISNTPSADNDQYLIPKCSLYMESEGCAVCKQNYSLSKAKANMFGQSHFCFKNEYPDNCSEIDYDYFLTNGKIRCETCNRIRGKYSSPIATVSKVCVEIPYKDNCIVHKVEFFDDSTLQCTECNANYYLNTEKNVCVARINKNILNCLKYFIDKDDCEEKDEVVVVSKSSRNTIATDVQKLLNNPPISIVNDASVDFGGWVMGCAVYESAKSCKKCFAHKYRNPEGFDYNTYCKTVAKEIKHCKYYNSDGVTCDTCEDFYMLVDNTCELITVINCDDPEAVNSCTKCDKSNPYLDGDGNCSKVYSNPWCLEYIVNGVINADSYVECSICNEGYYRDDSGVCRILVAEILNCRYYNGKSLCKTCKDGFYLDYDGKRCLINPAYDENCTLFELGTECSVCNFGYYLTDTGCVKCETDVNCAFCDPDKPAVCLMCKFGYTHDGQNCISTSGVALSEDYVRMFHYNPTVARSNLSGVNFEGIKKSCYMLFIVMLIFISSTI